MPMSESAGQTGGTWWRSPGWPIPVWVYTNAPYLSHSGYKVAEMMAPSVPPYENRVGPRNTSMNGLGQMYIPPKSTQSNGATPSAQTSGPIIMNPTAGTTPVFKDPSGNVITSAPCGSQYSMTVPGLEGQTVYIVQTKNGAPSFSGNMTMPMPAYSSICNQDEGTYNVQAFDSTSGSLLGQTQFTVTPGPGSLQPAGVPFGASMAPTTTSIGSFFSNLTTTQMIVFGLLGGWFLYSGLINPPARRR